MIFVSALSKRFKNVTAVSNLSFKAAEGDIVGFLGPNGAGKTTSMRLILGYLIPTEGTIRVGNYDPTENRLDVVKQIGYLPENNPLYTEMTVAEYLSFIAQVKKSKLADSLAKDVGLESVWTKKIEELSRGFKQRVGLAAALVGDPPILILDEPTSGLDPLEQEKIRDLIKSLAKRKTIIFSTHMLSEVEDVASRLIIINKGHLVYDGRKPKGKGMVEKLFKKLVKQ